MKFKQYLDSKQHFKGAIGHLSHIEDLVIEYGIPGIKEFINIIEDILSNNVDIKFKIDGAPALIFGIDQYDNTFFVSTKSIFSNSSRVIKSLEDLTIRGYEGDLYNKLFTAYDYLIRLKNFIKPGIAYHGDIIFDNSSKEIKFINNKKYITFTPNIITYAAPYETLLGKEIDGSNFGIVVHNKYSIDREVDGKFSFKQIDADIDSLTKYSKSIPGLYIINSSINSENIFNKLDISRIKKYLGIIKNSTKQIKSDFISIASQYKDLLTRISIYINSQVDKPDLGFLQFIKNNNYSPSTMVNYFYSNLLNYLNGYFDKKSLSLKSDKSKMNLNDTKNKWLQLLNKYEYNLKQIIYIYYNMIILKYIIFNNIIDTEFTLQEFVNINGKYERSSGEGFVVTTNKVNVKFVDRTVFTKLNRMIGKFRK